MPITNENALIKTFNKICDRAKKEKWVNLDKLTNSELCIFIAGKTLAYGRDWQASLENGEYHTKNPEATKKARRLFSRKIPDMI